MGFLSRSLFTHLITRYSLVRSPLGLLEAGAQRSAHPTNVLFKQVLNHRCVPANHLRSYSGEITNEGIPNSLRKTDEKSDWPHVRHFRRWR